MKTWHSDEPQTWSEGGRQRRGGRNKAEGKEHGKRMGKKSFPLFNSDELLIQVVRMMKPSPQGLYLRCLYFLSV